MFQPYFFINARISSKFHPNKVDLLVHIGLFHPTKVRSCFFQTTTWAGRLTYFSYEHVSVSQELHRDNEISAKPVSPVKRVSLTPYEQPLINNKHPRKIMMSVEYDRAGHMIYI